MTITERIKEHHGMTNDETMVDVPRMILVRLLSGLGAVIRVTPEYEALLDVLYPIDASVEFLDDEDDPLAQDENAP